MRLSAATETTSDLYIERQLRCMETPPRHVAYNTNPYLDVIHRTKNATSSAVELRESGVSQAVRMLG